MKVSIKSLAIACAVLWGGCVLLLGIANAIWSGYAVAFLEVVDSIYPGYHAGGGAGSVIVGTLYAILDGAVAGLLFGWIYNRFAGVDKDTQSISD